MDCTSSGSLHCAGGVMPLVKALTGMTFVGGKSVEMITRGAVEEPEPPANFGVPSCAHAAAASRHKVAIARQGFMFSLVLRPLFK